MLSLGSAQEGEGWLGTVAWGELEQEQQLQFWLLAWERCRTERNNSAGTLEVQAISNPFTSRIPGELLLVGSL